VGGDPTLFAREDYVEGDAKKKRLDLNKVGYVKEIFGKRRS
jgi:hypothetical protein